MVIWVLKYYYQWATTKSTCAETVVLNTFCREDAARLPQIFLFCSSHVFYKQKIAVLQFLKHFSIIFRNFGYKINIKQIFSSNGRGI